MATAELLRNENGSLPLFLPGVGEIQRVREHLASQAAMSRFVRCGRMHCL